MSSWIFPFQVCKFKTFSKPCTCCGWVSRCRGKEIHELLCVIWFNGKWAPENGHLKQKRQFWRKNSNLVRRRVGRSSNAFNCLFFKFWMRLPFQMKMSLNCKCIHRVSCIQGKRHTIASQKGASMRSHVPKWPLRVKSSRQSDWKRVSTVSNRLCSVLVCFCAHAVCLSVKCR